MIKSMIAAMIKAGRTTIDFSDENDVKFFTPLLAKALKKVKNVEEDEQKIPKAQNSYMEFCKETRSTTDFSDTKDPKEVSRRLGEMWRELGDKEKDVYKQRALANKERYDEACRARSTSPVSESESNKPKKAEKAKRPLSAYIKFCNANRSEIAKNQTNPQDVSRRLGEMWRGLSDEAKIQWKGDAVEDEVIAVKEEVKEKKTAKKTDEEDAKPVADDKKVKKAKKTDEPVEKPVEDDKKVKADKPVEEKPVEDDKKVKAKKTSKK
jgi:hypothetical protein